MTSFTDLTAARAKRLEQEELKEFQWIDRFILTRAGDDNFVDFTEEGRKYYQRWLTRYGYSVELMKSFDTFRKTVREILRLRVEETAELDPNDPLMQEIEEALKAGEAQALIEIASRIKAQRQAQVQPLR